MTGLQCAINEALECSLTVNELKEALSQLYAYTGFPRSLNALTELQNVIDDRTRNGLKVVVGKEASTLAED